MIKLTGAAIAPGLVRLSWVLTPMPVLDVRIDGKIVDTAETQSTIVFLQKQEPGKHVYQVGNSNKITLTVL